MKFLYMIQNDGVIYGFINDFVTAVIRRGDLRLQNVAQLNLRPNNERQYSSDCFQLNATDHVCHKQQGYHQKSVLLQQRREVVVS